MIGGEDHEISTSLSPGTALGITGAPDGAIKDKSLIFQTTVKCFMKYLPFSVVLSVRFSG